MTNNISNLHPNTIAFHCLEDSVAILIADIIHAIYSILNWRQSSKSFLIEILARLGEENKFECSHLKLAEILFPALGENVRRVKVLRWSQKFIEDLRDSLFQAVIVIPRRVGQSENGKYYGLPTLYKRGKFWKLFRAVQDAAIECDLLNLPLRNRRQKIRAIVEMYLNKIGAKRIVREKKEKERKEESASLPCRCDCASCALCAAKPGKSAELLRRLPNDFAVDLDWFMARYKQHLCETEPGRDFRIEVKRMWNAMEIAEREASDLIVQTKTGGQLRLVGGQLK